LDLKGLKGKVEGATGFSTSSSEGFKDSVVVLVSSEDFEVSVVVEVVVEVVVREVVVVEDVV